MSSFYLKNLSTEDRRVLQQGLLETQKGKCFICEKDIDLVVHANSVDIDHVEPLKGGGKDAPENFALTHASCNRSKQATDLRVARVMARFNSIRETVAKENRGPSLLDILESQEGSRFELRGKRQGNELLFSFSDIGINNIERVPIYVDELSGFEYFFVKIPIEYVYHDDRINPRSIGSNILGLVDEFHKKLPQLHVSLGWAELQPESNSFRIRIFDGQHKASAQILLGIRSLPVRVFLNPDLDILLTANTNAGTKLRQVAFDKSVQRHLGSALFQERIDRFRKERNLADGDESFSEKDLVAHFKGQSREVKKYVLDAVRDWITHNPENRLKDYVEFSGKGKDRPISYSSIEKTFYSFFIYGDLLETPLDHRLEEGENPRELEKSQILRLMNLVAEQIYIGQYDPEIGVSRVERKIQDGEHIPEGHVRSYRMAREEIMYTWLGYVRQIVMQFFVLTGEPVKEDRLFQYKFPEKLWDNIETFLGNMKKLPLWVNRELSASVFGGKQTAGFWQTALSTGKTPQGQQVLPGGGINLMRMIQK